MFGLFTYLGCRYLLINVAKFSDKKEWVVTYNRADDFKCKLVLLAQKGSRYRNLKNFTWIFSLFCQICDIMSPCKHFITHEFTNEFSWKSKPFKTKIGAVLWKMSLSNIISPNIFLFRESQGMGCWIHIAEPQTLRMNQDPVVHMTKQD